MHPPLRTHVYHFVLIVVLFALGVAGAYAKLPSSDKPSPATTQQTQQKAAKVPSGHKTKVAKKVGLVWDGHVFSSKKRLRAYLGLRGVNWRRFVRLHPAAISVLAGTIRVLDQGKCRSVKNCNGGAPTPTPPTTTTTTTTATTTTTPSTTTTSSTTTTTSPTTTTAPTTTTSAPPSSRLYTADFATGNFSQIDSLQESSSGRIVLNSPGLAGTKYAAAIVSGPQDRDVAGSGNNMRTELSVQSFASHLGGGSLQGKDVWVSWTFKLGTGFQAPSNWAVIGQFHAGVGSPSFALVMGPNGSIVVCQRGGTYVDGSGNYQEATILSSPARNVEYTVIVYRHWSVDSDGATKVWLNRDTSNTPNVSMVGPTLEKGYESAPYMKIGLYGSDWSSDNVVYVSDIRWATSAAGL
jgi:hypothetical protein